MHGADAQEGGVFHRAGLEERPDRIAQVLRRASGPRQRTFSRCSRISALTMSRVASWTISSGRRRSRVPLSNASIGSPADRSSAIVRHESAGVDKDLVGDASRVSPTGREGRSQPPAPERKYGSSLGAERGPASRVAVGTMTNRRYPLRGPITRLPLRIAVLAVAAISLSAIAPLGDSPLAHAPVGPASTSFAARVAPPSAAPARYSSHSVHLGFPTFGVPSFTGHYYAGSVDHGSNTTATDLTVDIQVPQDTPQATDFYYVLLSVWDDAKSYDQLGFTNDNGTWGVAYSTTSPCAATYYDNVNAFSLSPDTNYLFDMQLVPGSIDFSVSLPQGGTLWSASASSSASVFKLADTYTCNGVSSYDYTNYEEVYDTTAPVPPYAFFFTNNTEDSIGESEWIAWGSGTPPSVSVATGGTETIIENVPFAVSAAPTLVAEVGPFPRNYSENLSVAKYAPDTLLTPSISGSIPHARISIAPASGTAPVVFSLTVEVNASSVPGSGYPLEIEVTDTHGVYARIEVSVQLNANLVATVPAARPSSTDVNRSVSVTETPTGGSGTYAYQWSGLPSGCPNDTSTVTCSPHGAGTFTVTVEVSDSLGFFSNSTTLDLTVHPALSLTESANISTLDVGQSVAFGAISTGGSGGLTGPGPGAASQAA